MLFSPRSWFAFYHGARTKPMTPEFFSLMKPMPESSPLGHFAAVISLVGSVGGRGRFVPEELLTIGDRYFPITPQLKAVPGDGWGPRFDCSVPPPPQQQFFIKDPFTLSVERIMRICHLKISSKIMFRGDRHPQRNDNFTGPYHNHSGYNVYSSHLKISTRLPPTFPRQQTFPQRSSGLLHDLSW